ncbi:MULTISPECIES: carbohydrate ABC transporter permease [Halomonas]|uniref:Sugar ABC transporter permease n=2 Tax=Halomonas TaxID=2745 RepID=A0ABQ0U0W7_9GAMM|nr:MULTISPECIES: carbohydrate ABC transporter permease [Halomonas]KGE78451.1 sugar ABC transporter permease [Halomonas salina]MDR5888773.1 carbohydrate ABC transporter permease [Halomonas salina]RAH38702.1 carbohydrate ABC transporter permease [Halomonas sp. SL1]WJY07953.1 carbohydrate ABC transporter permease [Halomonas halophila]GEK72093.1 sugar ABC transporter permease [Halomonas halophila]
MNQYQLMKLAKRVGLYALIAVVMVYAIFPFYYAVITSLKPSSELFRVDFWLSSVDVSNYVQIFTQKSFVRAIFNSILISVSVVVIALLLGITASYALGRVRFRGRATVMLTILGVSMFPQVAVLSGLFEVIRALNLYNNPGGLILSYTIFTLPFTVWVLTTFMRQLPMELEEAAIMDGATPWVTITKVFLPLMWPAMATTGLLAFIAAWNEFLFALTFTLTDDQRTVPVAIALISGGSQHELPWGPIMAASVTVTVPLVILVMIFQRRIVSGLTAGAVKG